MISFWVIEFSKEIPCWIQHCEDVRWPYRVTYVDEKAQRFFSAEDAANEKLRLGLPGTWLIKEIRA